jgi:hypothetical protein
MRSEEWVEIDNWLTYDDIKARPEWTGLEQWPIDFCWTVSIAVFTWPISLLVKQPSNHDVRTRIEPVSNPSIIDPPTHNPSPVQFLPALGLCI